MKEHAQTIIIGGGQAGLTMGYHLRQLGLPFVILDASEHVGDAWRRRWDSLRLFTPARYNGLEGMPFPAPAHYFPTKDEMGDYLESYAAHFDLPVRSGVKVNHLSREGERFLLTTTSGVFEADNVVVAMAPFQEPRIPAYAKELDPGIRQLHSGQYLNPSQLEDGDVLVVGAGNSGAEIALDLAPRHKIILSGHYPGYVPFRIDGRAARMILMRLMLRLLFHRLATVRTPIGRKLRTKLISHGGPLVRTKPADIHAAGIERVGRVTGVRSGRPVLEDGSVLDVGTIVWCTGFQPGFSWIELPILQENGWPRHARGVVTEEPGLYFVGLPFVYAASSVMPHGLSRDARYLAKAIESRVRGEAGGRPRTTAAVVG